MKLEKPLTFNFTHNDQSAYNSEQGISIGKVAQLQYQIKMLQVELHGKNQHLEVLQQENKVLKKNNKKLQIENDNNQARQTLLDAEFIKIEAQMEFIIKNLT